MMSFRAFLRTAGSELFSMEQKTKQSWAVTLPVIALLKVARYWSAVSVALRSDESTSSKWTVSPKSIESNFKNSECVPVEMHMTYDDAPN